MENILNNSSSYIGNIKNAIQDFIDKIENLSTNIVNPTSFKLENISNSVKIYYMNDVNVSELLEFANSDPISVPKIRFKNVCANSIIITTTKLSNITTVSMIFCDDNGKCALLGSTQTSQITTEFGNVLKTLSDNLDPIYDQTSIKECAISAINDYISGNLSINDISFNDFIIEKINDVIQHADTEVIDTILEKFENSIISSTNEKIDESVTKIDELTNKISGWESELENINDISNFKNDVLLNFGYAGKINIRKNDKFMDSMSNIIGNKTIDLSNKVTNHIHPSNNDIHKNSLISLNDIKSVLASNETSANKQLNNNLTYIFNYVLNRLFANNYSNITHLRTSTVSDEFKWDNDPMSVTSVKWLGGYSNIMYQISKRLDDITNRLTVLEDKMKD